MAETKDFISRESILFGIVGLLAGSLITIVVALNAVNNNMTGMMRMMGIEGNQMQEGREEVMEEMMGHREESMTMDQMTESLKGKTGDEFDKAFIEEMIDHHQGAIEMAGLAKRYADHQEIKDLADDIIGAQTTEINMMQEWQKTWGY